MERNGQNKRLKNYSSSKRKQLVEASHEELSVRHQCELLSVPRSMHYYQPVGETTLNLELMRKAGIIAHYPTPKTRL